jgi:hypothetical protein
MEQLETLLRVALFPSRVIESLESVNEVNEIQEDEDELPSQLSIYSGYVAMDQIIRGTESPENIYSSRGSMEVIGSIRKLAWNHRLTPRPTWRDISLDKRWSTESALGIAEELEISRTNGSIPWLVKSSKEMQEDLIEGSCSEYNHSRWIQEDGWLKLKENQMSDRNLLSKHELTKIGEEKMLCSRKS